MLGVAQLDAIGTVLQNSVASGQPWQVIANQVLMAEVIAPDVTPYFSEEEIALLHKEWWAGTSTFIEMSAFGLPWKVDSWSGYPVAREKFYARARKAGVNGLLVVTGDSHTWWANDLVAANGTHMGVELGVTAVASDPRFDRSSFGGKGANIARLTETENKDVLYHSGDHHGYIALTLERDEARAEFIAVDTIETNDYSAFEKATFTVKRKDGEVKFAPK